MSNPDTIKSLWLSDIQDMPSMTSEDLRRKATKFGGMIERRNMREYLAAGFVIAIFAVICFFSSNLIARLGASLTILGVLFVTWSLYKKAGLSVEEQPGSENTIIGFHRAQLIKQRDALKSVFSWYILPLVPGVVIFILGTTPELSFEALTLNTALTALPRLLIVALVFIGVWWLNFQAARRLDQEIIILDKISEI